MVKKTIFAILLLSSLVAAIAVAQGTQATNRKHAQIGTPEGSNVNFVADNIERQNQVMHLKGNVEIKTHDMLLHADDVTYNQKTGEIESTGKVRIKLETQN